MSQDRKWIVDFDGPSRPIIVSPTFEHFSISKHSAGANWGPYAEEVKHCEAFCAAMNAKPEWMPIDTAPWEEEVLVKGPSGYCAPHDEFEINAYRKRDWHQGGWNDATGTPLMDAGWNPSHWKPKDERKAK